MKLADFWPTEANILQCIKPEAESDWDEVFLAIHQPMRLMKRKFKKDYVDDGSPASEEDFLQEFLRDDPTGTVVMPILGDSGIGKSHLVRWLDVQLKRRPDANRRHIIRIPKSSSLKTVLYRILKNLQGEQYDEIRSQLKAARERLDAIGAEERIRAEFLAEIRRRYIDACQNREDAKSRGKKVEQLDDEWYTHGKDKQCLPALLSDPATSRLFMPGTDQRPGIISQLARHLTTDSSEDRPPRRNFEEADLVPSDDLDISEASDIAKRYLQSLDRLDGRARKTAVRLLNSVIDSALQPLASPTDTSLSEIFLQIRRQLLADGRELVLLVEDFAVLSGIQGALLDAIIAEGVRDGQTDACVMRTALAVTTGYDFGRYDTVKTRAQYGWYVDESPVDDDDQMVGRICDYVGAYLNAARFGSDALKQRRSEFDDDHWPPHFGDNAELDAEDRQRLDAFGKSRSGWLLFPFNEAAVRQLSDIHLRDADNQLRLNPRTIINHLLIRVLRDYRSAWINSDFPSVEFLGQHAHELSASLQSEVRNAESNGRTRERYLALLRYWGDCPHRLAEVVLPQEVYEAFGLRPLSNSAPIPEVRPRFPERRPEPIPSNGTPASNSRDSNEVTSREPIQPEPMPVRAPVSEPVDTSEHPEEVRRWDRLLNGWNPSSILPQKEANELRLMLANHVLGAIDWDALFLRKLTAAEMKGWQGNIFLPNAKGTGNITPANAMCTVCTNEEFASIDQRNAAVLALIALARHEHYQNWDYPDAELDYARLQNLLERLVPQATEWILSKKYREFAGDPVPALVEHILLAARFLDVKTAHASDFVSLLNALFEPPPDLESPQAGDEWAEFKSETEKHHRVLQEELLARTAVRQGGAGMTYGVDCVRLMNAVRACKATSENNIQLPTYAGSEDIDAAVTFAKRFSARLSNVVRNQQNRLARIRLQCQTELGEDFDKSGLVTMLKEQVLPEAQRLGVLAGDLPRAADLQALCEEFRLARVSDTLKKLEATESDDIGTQVSSLAQIDNDVLGVIERFISTMSDTLVAVENKLKSELAAGEGMLDASKERIEQTLDRMYEQLSVIGGSST